MVQYRTSPTARVSRELAVFKGLAAALVAVVGYALLTGAAIAPATLDQLDAMPVASATLDRSGTDLTITGSVDGLFTTTTFVGPNRAAKTDRARPAENVTEFASRFDAVRLELAQLRLPKAPAVIAPVEAVVPATAPDRAPIQVASLSGDVSSAALDAIDALTGTGDGVPLPQTMSNKLAYARADLPATVFDGSVTSKAGKKVSDKEVWCMAEAIYFEARGESYRGQVAVGQVVMNRLAHPIYPKTICGVVFQNESRRDACQFSFACDGIPERVTDETAWKQANQIARDVIAGVEYLPEVGHATHYHATYVRPAWAPRMKKVIKIGMHVFYQFKRGWQFG